MRAWPNVAGYLAGLLGSVSLPQGRAQANPHVPGSRALGYKQAQTAFDSFRFWIRRPALAVADLGRLAAQIEQ